MVPAIATGAWQSFELVQKLTGFPSQLHGYAFAHQVDDMRKREVVSNKQTPFASALDALSNNLKKHHYLGHCGYLWKHSTQPTAPRIPQPRNHQRVYMELCKHHYYHHKMTGSIYMERRNSETVECFSTFTQIVFCLASSTPLCGHQLKRPLSPGNDPFHCPPLHI